MRTAAHVPAVTLTEDHEGRPLMAYGNGRRAILLDADTAKAGCIVVEHRFGYDAVGRLMVPCWFAPGGNA